MGVLRHSTHASRCVHSIHVVGLEQTRIQLAFPFHHAAALTGVAGWFPAAAATLFVAELMWEDQRKEEEEKEEDLGRGRGEEEKMAEDILVCLAV